MINDQSRMAGTCVYYGKRPKKEELLAAFVEGFKGAIWLWVSLVTAPFVAWASVVRAFLSHSDRTS
jgi:hypothetical protein